MPSPPGASRSTPIWRGCNTRPAPTGAPPDRRRWDCRRCIAAAAPSSSAFTRGIMAPFEQGACGGPMAEGVDALDPTGPGAATGRAGGATSIAARASPVRSRAAHPGRLRARLPPRPARRYSASGSRGDPHPATRRQRPHPGRHASRQLVRLRAPVGDHRVGHRRLPPVGPPAPGGGIRPAGDRQLPLHTPSSNSSRSDRARSPGSTVSSPTAGRAATASPAVTSSIMSSSAAS